MDTEGEGCDAWSKAHAAEGTREETRGLFEIDEYATKAASKTIRDCDRVLLDVVRTGAA